MAVFLLPYDPAWPTLAEGRAARLRVLGPVLIAVHHIGSTAVPGLAAKPVIDLMPLVADFSGLERRRGDFESLGYQWRGEFGIPGRRYCTLSDAAGTRLVNAHFFLAGAHEAERHPAFRDYLRAHPDAARAYTDEKDAWIRAAEMRAIAWYAAQRP